MADKILIIDDEVEFSEMVKIQLENLGYEVVLLNSPKTAIKVIKNENPDLILCDILMPLKDGYQMCEEIKERFQNKIPVILCTAKSYEKEFIEGSYRDFGADDFMLKPFATEEISKKIERLIHPSKQESK